MHGGKLFYPQCLHAVMFWALDSIPLLKVFSNLQENIQKQQLVSFECNNQVKNNCSIGV